MRKERQYQHLIRCAATVPLHADAMSAGESLRHLPRPHCTDECPQNGEKDAWTRVQNRADARRLLWRKHSFVNEALAKINAIIEVYFKHIDSGSPDWR
jgi:hypothetical protein